MRARLLLFLVPALLSACSSTTRLDEPRAYRCERGGDAAACPGGWRCGVDGFCYDRSVPAAVACEADADCADGWRCGQEGVCHDRAVAAAYACQADGDCEQGWRCGLEGVCLDPSGEALESVSGPLASERIGPVLLPRRPDTLAVAPREAGFGPAFAATLGAELLDVVTLDGAPGEVVHQALPAEPVRALAAVGREVYVLQPSGLRRFRYREGGRSTLDVVAADPGFVPVDLRVTHGPPAGLVLLSGDARVALLQPDGSLVSLTVPGAATPPEVTDVVAYQTRNLIGGPLSGGTVWLAATSQGLKMAPVNAFGVFVDFDTAQVRETPDWRPVAARGDGAFFLQAEGCPAGEGTPLDVRRFRVEAVDDDRDVPRVVVEARTADGSARTHLVRLDMRGFVACTVGDALQALAVCPPCPEDSQRLEDFRAGSTTTEARCQAALPDGGTFVQDYEVRERTDPRTGPRCEYAPLVGSGVLSEHAPTTVQTARADVASYAGEQGAVWSVTNVWNEPPAPTLFLDTAPSVLLGAGDTFLAMSPGWQGQYVPGVGLLRSRSAPSELLQQVDGASRWWLSGTFVGGSLGVHLPLLAPPAPGQAPDAPLLAYLETAAGPVPEPLRPPIQAAVTGTAGGRQQLVVTSEDSIFSADVTDALCPVVDGAYACLPQRAPVELVRRLAPEPRIPITSLALLPSSGGTDLVAGYALTPNGVLRVRAETQQRWSSARVDVPAGDLLEVWTDRTRARAGYVDGRVVSLPSALLLAPALEAGPVRDFATVCGRTVALTDAGLLSLEPGTGPVGRWAPFPLPSHRPEVPLTSLAGARLHVLDEALYLFTAQGEGVRLSPAGCPG